MFQAALGGAVLFNPERAGRPARGGGRARRDPAALLGGRAVRRRAAGPVGPPPRPARREPAARGADAGGRRDRRSPASPGPPLYLAALAVAGVSRFVLAGLSASLPHVVARRHLVEANVVAATAGAGVAALGGATAIGARALVGAGDAGFGADDRRRRRGLDPGRRARRRLRGAGCWARTARTSRTAPLVAVARGLVDGARATARTPTVAASFVALAAHRLAFGVSHPAHADAVTGTRSPARACCAAGWPAWGRPSCWPPPGSACAALLTPWLVHRLGPAADGPGRAAGRRGHPGRAGGVAHPARRARRGVPARRLPGRW